MRNSILSVLTDEYVKGELLNSLKLASELDTRLTVSEKISMCIDSLYNSYTSSKLRRIRESAEKWRDAYINWPNTVVGRDQEMLKDPAKNWVFSAPEISEDDVRRLFSR